MRRAPGQASKNALDRAPVTPAQCSAMVRKCRKVITPRARAAPAPLRRAFRARRAPISASSAAAIRGCRRRCIWPRPVRKVVLLEAQTIGFAASGRNGGQIHTGHRKDQAELERWLGAGHARDLWKLSEESKALVRGACDEARHRLRAEATGSSSPRTMRGRVAGACGGHRVSRAELRLQILRMLDADETAEKLGTDDLSRRAARYGRRTSASAVVRARAGGRRRMRPVRCCGNIRRRGASKPMASASTSPAMAVRDGGQSRAGVRRLQRARLRAAACALHRPCRKLHRRDRRPRRRIWTGRSCRATSPSPTRAMCSTTTARAPTDGCCSPAARAICIPPHDIAALVRPRMLRVFPAARRTSPSNIAWRGTVGITRTRMPHFGRSPERVFFAPRLFGPRRGAVRRSAARCWPKPRSASPSASTFSRACRRRNFPAGKLLRKTAGVGGALRVQDSGRAIVSP